MDERRRERRDGRRITVGVAASESCVLGHMAVMDDAGYVKMAAADSTAERICGVFDVSADNSDGEDGAVVVTIGRKEAFKFGHPSDTSAPITISSLMDDLYVEDSCRVTTVAGGPIAGKCLAVENDGVFVEVE